MFNKIVWRNKPITAEDARSALTHMNHWINKKRTKENNRRLKISKEVTMRLIKETIAKGETECDLIGVDDNIVPTIREWLESLGYTTRFRKQGFMTYITISWGDNNAD